MLQHINKRLYLQPRIESSLGWQKRVLYTREAAPLVQCVQVIGADRLTQNAHFTTEDLLFSACGSKKSKYLYTKYVLA